MTVCCCVKVTATGKQDTDVAHGEAEIPPTLFHTRSASLHRASETIIFIRYLFPLLSCVGMCITCVSVFVCMYMQFPRELFPLS